MIVYYFYITSVVTNLQKDRFFILFQLQQLIVNNVQTMAELLFKQHKSASNRLVVVSPETGCMFDSIKLYNVHLKTENSLVFRRCKSSYYICGDANTHKVYAYSAEKYKICVVL